MLTFSYTSEHSLLCLLPAPAELSKQQHIWLIADLARQLPGVEEVVVGMNNFTLYYQLDLNSQILEQQLLQLWQQTEHQQSQPQT